MNVHLNNAKLFAAGCSNRAARRGYTFLPRVTYNALAKHITMVL